MGSLYKETQPSDQPPAAFGIAPVFLAMHLRECDCIMRNRDRVLRRKLYTEGARDAVRGQEVCICGGMLALAVELWALG